MKSDKKLIIPNYLYKVIALSFTITAVSIFYYLLVYIPKKDAETKIRQEMNEAKRIEEKRLDIKRQVLKECEEAISPGWRDLMLVVLKSNYSSQQKDLATKKLTDTTSELIEKCVTNKMTDLGY